MPLPDREQLLKKRASLVLLKEALLSAFQQAHGKIEFIDLMLTEDPGKFMVENIGAATAEGLAANHEKDQTK